MITGKKYLKALAIVEAYKQQTDRIPVKGDIIEILPGGGSSKYLQAKQRLKVTAAWLSPRHQRLVIRVTGKKIGFYADQYPFKIIISKSNTH